MSCHRGCDVMLRLAVKTGTKVTPVAGCSHLQLRHSSSKSEAAAEREHDSNKQRLQNGPDLSDFIAGVIPRNSNWESYEGKLKLETRWEEGIWLGIHD